MVEFVLCFSIFWLPLFLGTCVFGFDLIRAIQVTQLCRDAGHMYASGTDFSQPPAQAILNSISGDISLDSSGNGVIVLSTITFVTDSDCQAANVQNNCLNRNKYVFTRQLTIGSVSGITFVSAFGTPASSIRDSSGGITQQNYLTDPSAVASNFNSISGITMPNSSQVSYVAEAMAKGMQPVYWSQFSNPTASARNYF